MDTDIDMNTLEFTCTLTMSKLTVYKNLLIVGFINLFQYSATNPTNALVTSVAGKTLGNVVYSLNYFFSCLFTLLSIPILSSQMKEKQVLLVSTMSLVFYTACNWYISYYTLIPGSFFHGLSVSITFVTSLVYANKLAGRYAREQKLNETKVISYFNGIVIAFSTAGFIFGNGTAAVVLTILKTDDNDDYVNVTTFNQTRGNFTPSDGECHTNDDALEFSIAAENVLRGIIFIYSVVGFLAVIFMDDLDKNDRVSYVINWEQCLVQVAKQVWPSLKSLAKLAITRRILLTIPLFIITGTANGFIFSSYTKVYVAECVGIHVIGYIIMTYGSSGTLGNVVAGKVLGLLPYDLVVIGNCAIHFGIMLFLIFWEREQNYLIIFLVPLIWGFSYGGWVTICAAFVGTRCGKETQTPVALYRTVYLFGISLASLLAFMPVKINQAIICASVVVFTILHLLINRISK